MRPDEVDANGEAIPQTQNVAQTVAGLALNLGKSEMLHADGLTMIVTPSGRLVSDLTPILEARKATPPVLAEAATLTREASFVAYVQKFATPSAAIFLDASTNQRAAATTLPTLRAILDYHQGPGDPRWGRHVATLPLRFSREWETWAADRSLSQREFADHIEQNVTDLTSIPAGGALEQLAATLGIQVGTPAQVIAASRGLSVSIDAQVQDAVTLQNGTAQVSFVEKQSTGQFTVPGLFAVAAPVFEGGPPYVLGIRVRYALKREGDSQRLTWRLIPHQALRLFEAARDDMAQRIEAATGIPVWIGSDGRTFGQSLDPSTAYVGQFGSVSAVVQPGRIFERR